MRTFRYNLTTTELDVVWRAEPLGALPLVLDVPSPGASDAERAAIETGVWSDLVERELADDHGRAEPGLASALRVLANHRRSLQLRLFGPEPIRAILAKHGRRAVLAAIDGDDFRMSPVPETGLVVTLLSLLPKVPTGQGHSVSVDTTAFAQAARTASRPAAERTLRQHGLGRDEARTLLDMATGAVRTGQIMAERRTADGGSSRTPRVIAFHDTRSGRYLAVRTISANSDHLTIAPATMDKLAGMVDQAARMVW